jgi:hypothetical protein
VRTVRSHEIRDELARSRTHDSQPRFAMFDNMILDITLGLLLFFLVLSLICSAVQEWIAGAVGLRSRNLRNGIDNLVGAEIAESFYNHGLLKSLYRQPGVLGIFKTIGGRRGVGPSYIEPRLFADVLVDVIDRGSGRSGTGARENTIAKTFQEVEVAVQALSPGPVREALLTLLADAKDDVDAFRQKAADWFDAAMDRVSGWYARRVKVWLFVIATGVVVLFNADAIEVSKKLWKDEALRASLAAIAEQIGQDQAGAGKPKGDDVGEATTEDAQMNGQLPTPAKALADLDKFPIGWKCEDSDELCRGENFRGVQSLVGWLVSILACSLGAPFCKVPAKPT